MAQTESQAAAPPSLPCFLHAHRLGSSPEACISAHQLLLRKILKQSGYLSSLVKRQTFREGRKGSARGDVSRGGCAVLSKCKPAWGMRVDEAEHAGVMS
eukprot:3830431-Rhodomonas_salina.1